MKKKLLYLSCHQILEYDEVKLFSEMGYDVFSTGSYAFPFYREGMSRPGIDTLTHYPELERLASTIVSSGYDLPQELIDWADIIVFMHMPDMIEKNLHKLVGKRTIYRSIGQSIASTEDLLRNLRRKGIEIVRYSPKEVNIPNYAGSDALIRFYKDPNDFKPYTGRDAVAINVTQSAVQRAEACRFPQIKTIGEGHNFKVYGNGNPDEGMFGGSLSYEALLDKLTNSRAYIYGGTFPACYTLSFMEAMMTGIPIFSVGRRHGNMLNHTIHFDYFEVPDIIEDGITGFCSDNLNQLNQRLGALLHDRDLAIEISLRAREKAIELFGKDNLAPQWQALLG